jgi:hypothetical protein
MFKKLFVTAAAAAALSVPLAGVASADSSTNNGNGGGIGAGGIPERVNDIAAANGLPDPNGPDAPNTPGSVINNQIGHTPGVSTPEAYGNLLDVILPGNPYPDKVPVGMGVKASGPGCNRGHTASGLPVQAVNCPPH